MIGELELNRIYQRDCIEGMRLIPDKSIDMILCDLPYGTTKCKWDTIIPLDEIWKQYERIIKENGAIVLTAQTPFDKVLGNSNLKLLRYEWLWIKEQGTGNLNANKMPLKQHENILVFYKKLPTYNPQFSEGKPYKIVREYNGNEIFGKTGTKEGYVTKNEGKRYPTSALYFNRELRERYHPTQKPVALFEYLIKTYTNEEEIVLDNCMGSGTTAVASLQLNRNFIGFETEPEYVKIANQRLEAIERGSSLKEDANDE
ncbi:site-specific DNA-methyltransferase [Bacillus inaquosorum]|uniref:DNA-methyltransferase n=1 Tax=Bacillus inaquosorum TaxID=483913 RepID=UPI00228018C6|nr:site-specific DNA-methyltransferase [Bacillus inaquosorum]MCY7751605.1 site-specific DNA-methyltransferase [Bacillus inaquosorum]